MAANSQGRGIASLGKRFAGQIRSGSSCDSTRSSLSRGKRAVHGSVYDKNLDEQVRPTVVPDELIEPKSDKYWAPHPHTGVFGPADNKSQAAGSKTANADKASVLEEKAFFRPLEDLEKPPPHP